MAKRKSVAISEENQSELTSAQQFSVALLKQAKWFYDLTVDEQAELEQDTVELAAARINFGMSGLQLGSVLSKINQLLVPYDLWVIYLQTQNFSVAKGVKLVAAYRNVVQHLNSTILEQAMLSGIDLIGYQPGQPFGRYTQAVEALPTPSAEVSPQEAREWLMQVKDKNKELRQISALDRITQPINIEAQIKAALIPAKRAFSKISIREDLERAVMQFAGMLIQSLGIGHIHDVEPQPVPDGWLVGRGRPRKQLGSGEAQEHADEHAA